VSRLKEELPRKAVHVAMGGFALALRWLTPWAAIACAAFALEMVEGVGLVRFQPTVGAPSR